MWSLNRRGQSGFSSSSTAEEVTEGIDGTGLTAIVTVNCGGSTGIGAETVRVLALRGVHVVMGVRNLSTGHKVKEAIIKEAPNVRIDVLELDLSSMASVKNFASEFVSLNLPLNILINNAGVMGVPFSLSHDGLELHFATNHIGHFLLTNLLIEKMKETTHSCNIEGRIVNVSSMAHQLTYCEGIRFDKINKNLGYNTYLAYGQSKLANILHVVELSRRFEEGVNITANSLHPGSIYTDIYRHNSVVNAIMRTFAKVMLKTIPQGAATTCYVALHPQVNGVTGKYFYDCNVAKPSSKASDADFAKKLWDFSMDIISPWI